MNMLCERCYELDCDDRLASYAVREYTRAPRGGGICASLRWEARWPVLPQARRCPMALPARPAPRAMW